MPTATIQPHEIAIAIKTHQRKGQNYLVETYENLMRAGAASWITRGSTTALAISDGRGLTLHQNAANAIRMGVEMNLPWVLVLEDDLDFCADFLGSVARWLTDYGSSGYLMYVFGANYPQIAQAVAHGQDKWEYPIEKFYGAQALCWRREVAAELVEWLGEDPAIDGVRDHGHDLLLQRWARARDQQYFLASAPSFVQHVGEESGIGNRYFRFESWPGREWRYEGKR